MGDPLAFCCANGKHRAMMLMQDREPCITLSGLRSENCVYRARERAADKPYSSSMTR